MFIREIEAFAWECDRVGRRLKSNCKQFKPVFWAQRIALFMECNPILHGTMNLKGAIQNKWFASQDVYIIKK